MSGQLYSLDLQNNAHKGEQPGAYQRFDNISYYTGQLSNVSIESALSPDVG